MGFEFLQPDESIRNVNNIVIISNAGPIKLYQFKIEMVKLNKQGRNRLMVSFYMFFYSENENSKLPVWLSVSSLVDGGFGVSVSRTSKVDVVFACLASRNS